MLKTTYSVVVQVDQELGLQTEPWSLVGGAVGEESWRASRNVLIANRSGMWWMI